MATYYDKLKQYTDVPKRAVQQPAMVIPQITAPVQNPGQAAVPPEIAKNAKTVIETESVSNDFQPIQNTYRMQAFTPEMEKQALEDAENSTAFSLIMDERNRRQQEYQDRMNNSAKAAKALAWTNLLTNLAKLGGMGNAPIIKEDTTHLFKAFNDVDKVRDLLMQNNDKYSTALTNAKLQYVQNARDTHNARERAIYDAYQKYAEAYNKAGLESRTRTKTRYEYDPNQQAKNALEQDKLRAQIAQINARKDLTEQQKAKIIAELEKGGSGSGKDKPFYEFENQNDGYTYRISKSKAVDIENYLGDIKAGKVAGVGPSLKKEVEDDLSILSRVFDADMKDAETLRIISKYLQKYPDLFRQFTNSATRVKTNKNTASSSFQQEEDDMTTSYE